MTRTFKEMPWFTKEWTALGFDDDALAGLQQIIYLIAVYKKADKEDLSQKEKNEIKKLTQELKNIEREAWRK